MPSQNKTIDFFRPSRPTDPLASRRKISSKSSSIHKPNKSQASSPPALKARPRTAPKISSSHSEVINPSVAMKKTVIKRTVIGGIPTVSITSSTTTSSSIKPTPRTISRIIPQNAANPTRKSTQRPTQKQAQRPVALPQKELPKSPQGKITYPFGGESPFLTSVKVEKRPLSGNSLPKTYSNHNRPNSDKDLDHSKRNRPHTKKKNNSLSLIVIIIVTIILGIAAGIGVFFLITK